jgi:3-oxoacyl-[acyl-carrier protein] reductase
MMRSVLVTGASKGIGKAIASQLAGDGFLVVIHYHSDKAGAESTLQQITDNGGSGRIVQFDISNGAPFTFLKTLQYPAVVSVGTLQMDI